MAASPEHTEGQNPESEKGPLPFYQAARFRAERLAGRAYEKAQALIFTNAECNLSAFRFHVERDWYVTVLGEEPAVELREKIGRILRAGVAVELPPPLLQAFQERRAEALKKGSWIERHYPPEA
jgi:hypothetical protein